jgi:type IV pilus assembly protein PilA
MKNCPNCAEVLQDQDAFCPKCGANVATVAPVPVVAASSGKAIASLILGFFAWFFPAAIVGVILGHVSRGEIQRSGGKLKGSGMALAGLIMGYAGVAIVPFLIIAAIAIPNLLKARIAANQASAVMGLRSVNTSAVEYSSTYAAGYPETLAALGPAAGGKAADANAADLIDGVLASGRKANYVFMYRVTARDATGHPSGYSVNAEPVQGCGTGNGYCYFTDETMVIRFDESHSADKDSPPLGG